MAKAKAKTIYDVHPGVAMAQKWVSELKEKKGAFTGRMDCAGEERRTKRREIKARMAEDQVQIGDE